MKFPDKNKNLFPERESLSSKLYKITGDTKVNRDFKEVEKEFLSGLTINQQNLYNKWVQSVNNSVVIDKLKVDEKIKLKTKTKKLNNELKKSFSSSQILSYEYLIDTLEYSMDDKNLKKSYEDVRNLTGILNFLIRKY